jgi:MFS transporter
MLLAAVPLALTIGAPVSTQLIYAFGWRGMFLALTVISAVWIPLWLIFFRDDPAQSRFVSRWVLRRNRLQRQLNLTRNTPFSFPYLLFRRAHPVIAASLIEPFCAAVRRVPRTGGRDGCICRIRRFTNIDGDLRQACALNLIPALHPISIALRRHRRKCMRAQSHSTVTQSTHALAGANAPAFRTKDNNDEERHGRAI